ncbi:hypothetical protein [Paenibacillus aquistagni]|uniref:hypothetical protein n=1 Tax=Paenibacillus aquistagni TaxID=1852522 RepID=UPI00145AC04D|nr:hypothetical protein [Paenibacillus aquistagni]NMM52485.1 hypothetical protein [Paenibacillus aquistagni]
MKRMGALILCLGLVFGMIVQSTSIYANSVQGNTPEGKLQFNVEAVLTNNETGDMVDYKVKDAKRNAIKMHSDGAITESYEIMVSYPVSPITPYDSVGGSKEENLVKATLSITYYTRTNSSSATDQDIKITNITGGWQLQSQYLTVSNRTAAVTDGVPFGKVLKKNPTSNTFNYDTGWGYVEFYPHSDISGPRGYTEATIEADGMGGSHNLYLGVVVFKS